MYKTFIGVSFLSVRFTCGIIQSQRRIVPFIKIKMGCVGGTIPTTDELVKTMKRTERKDKVSGRSY